MKLGVDDGVRARWRKRSLRRAPEDRQEAKFAEGELGWMTGFEPATSGATVEQRMIRTSRIVEDRCRSCEGLVGRCRVTSGGFGRRVSRMFQVEVIVRRGAPHLKDRGPALTVAFF